MDFPLRLLLIVFMLINVTAQTNYDQEVTEQGARAQSLQDEIVLLQTELEQLAVITQDKKNELEAFENFAATYNEAAINAAAPFYATLLNEFNTKMADFVPIFDEYVTNITQVKYEYIYNGLIKRIEDYTSNYDTRNLFIRKRLNDTDAHVSIKLEALATIKDGLVATVNDILNNNLSNEEKLAKLAVITELQDDLYKISRQIQKDGFHEEEKQRSDGNSGIKQIRTSRTGAENYFSNTHTGSSFAAIHDHSNNILTVGMGEFIGVLNGVEFRTRHNDYQLRKPVSNDLKLNKVEPVELPGIPPAVTSKATIELQIEEMRLWFKAFNDQDHSVRDYRPYFRPILTYLEGAWTTGGDSIDEPFESDRHSIDAKTWLDLQEKVRFTSYAGSKSLLENLAHLPTKIIRFTDDRQPVLAQWNYRILVHPIEGDFSLDNLKLVVDPTVLKRNAQTEEKFKTSRAPKFDIEGIDIDGVRQNHPIDYSFLDTIMEQIPGKDNYNAPPIHIQPHWEHNGEKLELYSANPNKPNEKLNAGYYHRSFLQKDSSGQEVRFDQRGFSDRMWVAHTNQNKVAQVSYNYTENGQSKRVSHRVSYAIPVEIIWLTPLNSWNPYNIANVKEIGVSGTGEIDDAFNGYTDRGYFLTPSSFFSGQEVNPDPADTIKSDGYVMKTPSGDKYVSPSGTRILFPEIPGIPGKMRQRFPVMPIHGEGSAVWKKLNAVEDMIKIKNSVHSQTMYFFTGSSHSNTTTAHRHIIEISVEDYNKLIKGDIATLTVTASTANAHFHTFTISVDNGSIFISVCDSTPPADPIHVGEVCFDWHTNTLSEEI